MKNPGSPPSVQDTASSLSDRSGFWRFFVLAALLAFILLYGLLASVWEAVNREFWIHVLVATAVLVAARLRTNPGVVPGRVGLLAVVLLGVVSFISAILPFSDRSNDFWWPETAGVTSQLDRGDVVVIECPWLCARYIEFFSEARVYRYQQLGGFGPEAGRDRFAFERLDPATLRHPSLNDKEGGVAAHSRRN